jgi:hypothetical protein
MGYKDIVLAASRVTQSRDDRMLRHAFAGFTDAVCKEFARLEREIENLKQKLEGKE